MRWAARLLPLVVFAAACSSSQPATTPATVATTEATTTTTVEVTTTLDRIAEIEAIYQDLEERRLDALYRGDREAFRELFANEAYLATSLGLFDLMQFAAPPGGARIDVLAVLRETESCIALETEKDFVGVLVGADGPGVGIEVLERTDSGWGFSYNGEGWLCEGPHPLSS